MKPSIFSLYTIVILLETPSFSQATVLPDFMTVAQVNVGIRSGDVVDSHTATGAPSSAAATVSVPSGLVGLGQPSNYVALGSATSAPFGNGLSGGNPFVATNAQSEPLTTAASAALLRYYFSIDGAVNSTVPVNLDLLFRATAGNFFNGQISYGGNEGGASFYLKISNTQTVNTFTVASFNCGSGSASPSTPCGNLSYQTETASFFAKSNTVYSIEMYVSSFTAGVVSSGLGLTHKSVI